jgi:hypothetical protein
VRHALDIGQVPYGTGAETRASYDALNGETISGEIRVSIEVLTDVTGRRPRVWRSPYLTVNPRLYDALAANGVIADSSYGIGDFQTNLPFSTAAVGFNQGVFHHAPLTEYLISCEDGLGSIDANGVEFRAEMQPGNVRQFLTTWTNILVQNARNRAHSLVLIHPSYGVGVGPENLQAKLLAADRILRTAEAAGLMTNVFMDPLTVFWRARDQVQLDASFTTAGGYTGSVQVGAEPITNLTLEFGDAIRSFDCTGCGTPELRGTRVVLRGTLSSGSRATFTATP